MKIAAILTVYNRKQKTLSCLQHLFSAVQAYNRTAEDAVALTVFLTDDGCTDGTADAVRMTFADADIRILQGNGQLFWAGGMRFAWQAAISEGTPWDYFLLLNDDTNVADNVFGQLLAADRHGATVSGCHGLSSGFTCEPGHPDVISYGGLNFVNKTRGRQVLLQPNGRPQHIDLSHANILLVHAQAVQRMGIFHEGFQHGCADMDYSMMAHHHGLPVFSTATVCGECECDHGTSRDEIDQLAQMTLAERRRYVSSPTHSDRDYLLFVKRNMPLRYPVAVVLRGMRLRFPRLYRSITHFRGVYKSR